MDKGVLDVVKGAYDLENFAEWLNEKAQKIAVRRTKNYGTEYVKKITDDVCSKVRAKYMTTTTKYECETIIDDVEGDDFISKMNTEYLMPRTREDIKAGRPGKSRAHIPASKKLNKEGRAELRKLVSRAKNAKIEEISKRYFADADSIKDQHEREFRIESYALEREIYNSIEKMKLFLGQHKSAVKNISSKIKEMIGIDSKYVNEGAEIDPSIMEELTELSEAKFATDAKTEVNKLYSDPKFVESVNAFNETYDKIIKSHVNMNRTNLVVDALKNIRDSKLRIYSLRNNY